MSTVGHSGRCGPPPFETVAPALRRREQRGLAPIPRRRGSGGRSGGGRGATPACRAGIGCRIPGRDPRHGDREPPVRRSARRRAGREDGAKRWPPSGRRRASMAGRAEAPGRREAMPTRGRHRRIRHAGASARSAIGGRAERSALWREAAAPSCETARKARGSACAAVSADGAGAAVATIVVAAPPSGDYTEPAADLNRRPPVIPENCPVPVRSAAHGPTRRHAAAAEAEITRA